MPRNETVIVIGQLDILDHSRSINLCKNLYIGSPEGSLKHTTLIHAVFNQYFCAD